MITTFDEARSAVANGVSPITAASELVATMTEDERLWCLDGDAPTWEGLRFLGRDGYHKAPFVAANIERIGLRGIAFADGPRGAVIGNATCFPVAMARGATWDPELEARVGAAIGAELRALGANLTGAVCVNVLRHPAWGRAQETYGEDPFQVGEMGAAFTDGLQQYVMACMKHFACNSMENARFSVDIEVDEVALHEVFLPHFKRIADAGVASVMSAYNSVNGEWCGQSPALLTDVLRSEWGFEGFVISDWIFGLRDAATSLTAGLDIEMPYRMIRAQHLTDALARGDASWADVDAAVTRVISTLLRFDDVIGAPAPPSSVVGSTEHRALAREVAARSVVLLRNELVGDHPMLPLPAAPGRVAVVGVLGNQVNLGDAGSSDVWDLECRTILDGLRAATSDVVFDDGTDIERACAVAEDADVVVVVVGTTYLDEGEYIGETDSELPKLFPPSDEPHVVDLYQESLTRLPTTVRPPRIADRPRGFGTGGDRTMLRLSHHDVALVRACGAANPRVVVALQTGSAMIATEWIDSVPAVVQSWYAGCEAGPGLADVLFGIVNPSARMPFSVPADERDLPDFDRDARSFRYDRWHGWWHLQRNESMPLFPFGFGLSYTSFAVEGTTIDRIEDGIVVHGVVRNTGACDGAEVVQVYAHLPAADAPPRLVGFARVDVGAGASASFRVVVNFDRFATRDADRHAWNPASGAHRITVARNACDPDAVHHVITI